MDARLPVSFTIQSSADSSSLRFNPLVQFGGNPVSCAVGLAVLDVIEEEDLRGNAQRVGDHLKQLLLQLQEEHALIGDVRGVGLFVGMELVKDRSSREPATGEAAHLVQRLKEERVVISTDGPWESVIKFKPPMCFSKADAERVAQCIHRVLKELESSRASGECSSQQTTQK